MVRFQNNDSQSIYRCLGGKCGVCGDSYTGTRYHEMGGKYATNIIVRHYLSGASIDVKILVRIENNRCTEILSFCI